MTPACSCDTPGQEAGGCRRARPAAGRSGRGGPPRRRPSCEDSASRQRPGCLGWLAMCRPARRRCGRSRPRGCAPPAGARTPGTRGPWMSRAATSRTSASLALARGDSRSRDSRPARVGFRAAARRLVEGRCASATARPRARRARRTGARRRCARGPWVAQLERGDPLARDALHHGRAGEEHLRVVARHDREVAERRRVRRAPAHGPPITLICGTLASACAWKIAL